MTYIGQFQNISGTNYQIEFDIKNSSSSSSGTAEIIFSEAPIRIEYNNNDNNLYEPFKLSNASIEIISDVLLTDLYNSKAQDVKCTLSNLDTNKIEWVGYVTPNVYNQPFTNEYEKITIEAIDGLSTLKNYVYTQIDSDNMKVKSFRDIIIHCISKCNCYSNIYVNQNYSIEDPSTFQNSSLITNVIEKLYVAEANFYTANNSKIIDNSVNINNDNVYILANQFVYYADVLKAILEYLNYTIVAWKDSVYILNYNYIKSGKSNYTLYSTTDNWNNYTTSQVSFYDIQYIDKDSFRNSDTNLELDKTYNQIVITSRLNQNKNLLPDFFDNNLLINYQGDWNAYSLAVTYLNTDKVGYDYFFKYYKHKNYTSYYYNNNLDWGLQNINTVDYTTTQKYIGATIIDYFAHSINWNEYPVGSTAPAVSTLSFEKYILLHSHLPAYPTSAQNALMPVLTLNLNAVPECGYLMPKMGLVINGSAYWSDVANFGDTQVVDPPLFMYDKWSRKEDTSFTNQTLFLTASLSIGNKYWDGTKWTLNSSTFKIFFDRGSSNHLYYTFFDVLDTDYASNFFNTKGQLIPISEADGLVGDIKFTLYSPQNIIPAYRVDAVWLKNFSIQIVTSQTDKINTTDTQYVNVINDDFVNIFNNIDLTVATDTNKGISYSSVIQASGDTFAYCNSLFDNSLHVSQKQEYNIIENYVNQYSSPQKIINLTLENKYKPYSLLKLNKLFPDDNYIITKMAIDYQMDNNLLTIRNVV
jgi:hypothetical protein